jgi:transcriptional regulator with XRE-family HTH domain
MKLKELLIDWNGVLRGPQARLARELKLSTPGISERVNGRTTPSEANLKKMSKIFKKSEAEIKEIFGVKEKFNQAANNGGNVDFNFIKTEFELQNNETTSKLRQTD